MSAAGAARPAGELTRWTAEVLASIRDDAPADVPCDGCTACCRSAQFILVTPDDTAALAHIPSALLVPAPGLPGHRVLGYDERGHCPMLIDDRCSIYEHRPTACRTYDCRIFAATGVDVGDERPLVAERVAEWEFDATSAAAGRVAVSLRSAASFLAEHGDDLPDGAVPANPTQRAVLAVDVHELFLASPEPTVEAVAVAIAGRRQRRYGRRDADARP